MHLSYRFYCGKHRHVLIHYAITISFSSIVFIQKRPRLPFDWRNPTSYLFAIILQFTVLELMSRIVACIVCIAVASLIYSLPIAKDVKDFLLIIDENGKSKKTQPRMMDQICEFINYTHLRRLSIKIQ